MARVSTWSDVARDAAGRFLPRSPEIAQVPVVPTAGSVQGVAEVVKPAAVAVARQSAGDVAKGVAKGTAPMAAVMVLAETGHTIYRYRKGEISKEDALAQAAASAGGGAMSVGGASLGAVIGSFVLPGPGTAAGGMLGGVLGGMVGRLGAGSAMRKLLVGKV